MKCLIDEKKRKSWLKFLKFLNFMPNPLSSEASAHQCEARKEQ